MHFKHIIAALVAFGSLAAAAPAQDSKATGKGQNQNQSQEKNQNNDKNNNGNKGKNQNNNNNNNRGGDVTIIQNIIKPNIIVVQENLDKINQLQQQNERQLAALVQSQLALATQLQTVKDNIRINHFKAQFPQANTIIVTVTGLVDNRSQGNQNKRYLVNQLLADNGAPGKQALVMVTDPTLMEISTQNAASSQANAFGAARVALESPSLAAGSNDTASNANGNSKAAAIPDADEDSTLKLAAFNQAAPFGQIGQSVILPAGTQAPQLASVPDPAAIILPQQQGLFVQNAGTFLSDCATSAANAASGNPALAGAAAQIFSSFEQIAAAQLAGLSGLGVFNGNNTAQVGQPLGAVVVGANQGQPPAAAQPPAPAASPPQPNAPAPAPQPPAAIVAGANQANSPVQIGKSPEAPPQAAPASPAAIVAGANQGQPAAQPQGNKGSGVVIVGSSPGGQSAAQPQANPAPADVVAGANQGQTISQPAQPQGAPASPAPISAGVNQAQPPTQPAR